MSVAPEPFHSANRSGRLSFVASPDGRHGSLRIRQDAVVYSSILDTGRHLIHEMTLGERAWLHVVRGELKLGNVVLATGDGVGIQDTEAVSFTAGRSSEILFTVLPECDPSPSS